MSQQKRTASLIILGLAAVGLFLLHPCHLEAEIYGKIKGRIIAEDTGEGLEGVEVRIFYTDSNYAALDPTHTDKEGRFTFEEVKAIFDSKYHFEEKTLKRLNCDFSV